MNEEEPKTPTPPEQRKSGSSRRALTPELRRFLNTPRAIPPIAEEAKSPPAEGAPAAEIAPPPAPVEGRSRRPAVPKPRPLEPAPPKTEQAPSPPEKSEPARPAAASVSQVEKASRVIELQHALLIIGALVLVGLAFYGGTKLNYLRYLIASRQKPALEETGRDLFPGIGAEDLVKQALVAQKEGRLEDAVERFMAAKRKNLRYRGILFRVGTLLADEHSYAAADKAFERAMAFSENVDEACFQRGLIATRQNQLAAAEQFFQQAAAAAPFVANYPYFTGEAFRLDLKPKQSIPFYERAALLASREQDAIICRFKIRLARIEATEGDAVRQELAKKAAAGPLSVAWLMTSAALDVRAGQVGPAMDALRKARAAKDPMVFASCVNDFYFKEVAKDFPELADLLRLNLEMEVAFPADAGRSGP